MQNDEVSRNREDLRNDRTNSVSVRSRSPSAESVQSKILPRTGKKPQRRSPSAYSDTFINSDSDLDDQSNKDIRHQKRASGQGRENGSTRRTRQNSKNYNNNSNHGRISTNHRTDTTNGGGLRGGNPATIRRIVSAERFKINELRNQVADLSGQIHMLEGENRQLRIEQKRRARAIERFEVQDTDVPAIVHRQQQEAHELSEELKEKRRQYDDKDRVLRQTQEELEKTRRQLKKMKTLIDDKKLGERELLSDKLSKAETDLTERDRDIERLVQQVENLNKNHKQDLATERTKYRETQGNIQYLQNEIENIRRKIRDKERELDVGNIYSCRRIRPPHRLTNPGTSLSAEHSELDGTRMSRYQPLKIKSSDGNGRNMGAEDILMTDDAVERRRKQLEQEIKKKKLAAEREKESEAKQRATESKFREDELARLDEDNRRLEREFHEEHLKNARTQQRLRNEQNRESESEVDTEDSTNQKEAKRQLLENLKRIDEGKEPAPLASQTSAKDEFFVTSQTMQKKKSFSSTAPAVAKPKPLPVDDENLPTFGDYKPSFLATGSAKPRTATRRDGTRAAVGSSVNADDGLLFSSDVVDNRNVGSTKVITNGTNQVSQPTNESTGFAGSRNQNRSRMLPRRDKQPAVSVFGAIEDLDDDIEEMTL